MGPREVTASPVGGWSDEAQVAWYLERIGTVEARQAGEQLLLDVVPPRPRRVLDLGCGDGRLVALILANRPGVEDMVGVDRSPPMLARARARFSTDTRVTIRELDLRSPLRPLGKFDLVMSGFAIHHLEDERKRSLFNEVAQQLHPGGSFLNLEVVSSATARRHADFLAAIGRTSDDPEDRLAAVEDQLRWMRDAGLDNVDCLWRWRGFALLAAEKW